MKTIERTHLLSMEALQSIQTNFVDEITQKEYDMYEYLVNLHNESKVIMDAVPGDIMICNSLDGDAVYNDGHIERANLTEFSSVCTEPMMPFVIQGGGMGLSFAYPKEFKTNTSGGYWFRCDKEEVTHVGFRDKMFQAWGRNGAKAGGTFIFPLNVNVWTVTSKEVY